MSQLENLTTTLIKMVANAILSYNMSLFIFPKALCHDIDSTLRKLCWGYPQKKEKKSIVYSSLAGIGYVPPRPIGALGLRNMEFHNRSLLAKF
jgi:hypothetical protein